MNGSRRFTAPLVLATVLALLAPVAAAGLAAGAAAGAARGCCGTSGCRHAPCCKLTIPAPPRAALLAPGIGIDPPAGAAALSYAAAPAARPASRIPEPRFTDFGFDSSGRERHLVLRVLLI